MEIEHGYDTNMKNRKGSVLVSRNIRPLRCGWKMKEKYYNNERCQTCKFARNGVGNAPKYGDKCHCERSIITGETCLVKSPDGRITDRRGRLHDNCKLYEKREVKC